MRKKRMLFCWSLQFDQGKLIGRVGCAMTLLRNNMSEISSFHVAIFLMCQVIESHDCLLYSSKAISYFRPPSNTNEDFTRPAYRHMMRKSTTKSGIALGLHIEICSSSQYRKLPRDWYSNSTSGRLLMWTLLSGWQNLHNVPHKM